MSRRGEGIPRMIGVPRFLQPTRQEIRAGRRQRVKSDNPGIREDEMRRRKDEKTFSRNVKVAEKLKDKTKKQIMDSVATFSENYVPYKKYVKQKSAIMKDLSRLRQLQRYESAFRTGKLLQVRGANKQMLKKEVGKKLARQGVKKASRIPAFIKREIQG